MNPKVATTIWGDPDFEELRPSEKLCVLWLLTNPRVDMIGVVSFSEKRFEFETGCKIEDLATAIEAFGKSFVTPLEGLEEGSNKVVFIKNFIKFQYSSGSGAFDSERFLRNNLSAPVLSCASKHCGTWVYDAFAEVYPTLAESLDFKPLQSPYQAVPKDKDKEKEKEKENNTGNKEKDKEGKTPSESKRSRAKVDDTYSIKFLEFWDAYPARNGVRNGKREAWKAWIKNGCEPKAPEIVAAVQRFATTPQWTKDNGQFVPMASTFLNQARWEDELAQPKASTAQRALGLPASAQTVDGEPIGWKAAFEDLACAKARENAEPDLEQRYLDRAAGLDWQWHRLPDYLREETVAWIRERKVKA
jgi:hypothetical protein